MTIHLSSKVSEISNGERLHLESCICYKNKIIQKII